MTLDPLCEAFRQHFDCTPSFEVHSPGRVNLIGEHTDYNMLPVLPIAVNYGLRILVAPSSGNRVRVVNSDARYVPLEFELQAEIPKGPPGDWGNYVKAPLQYLYERVRQMLGHEPCGFSAMVESNLPSAAGLSSSSATVVGFYLAFASANGVRLERYEEAEAMRLAERYVGTASGGMDQATILLGKAGKALYIEFDPVHAREVQLPGDVIFFAVDSLERAAKSGGARLEYNRRTFECQCSVELVRRHVLEQGRNPGCYDGIITEAPHWNYLRDVRSSFRKCGIDPIEVAREVMGEKEWSVEEMHQAIGSRCDELLDLKMLPLRGDAAWASMPKLRPFARLKHVLGEADRVDACAAALERGDLGTASRMMDESHASCRDLYGISTPRIESLVKAAKAAGALTARITGAGFGGSVVAMVRREDSRQFRERIYEAYFLRMLDADSEAVSRCEECILECIPSDGAHVVDLRTGPDGCTPAEGNRELTPGSK